MWSPYLPEQPMVLGNHPTRQLSQDQGLSALNTGWASDGNKAMSFLQAEGSLAWLYQELSVSLIAH